MNKLTRGKTKISLRELMKMEQKRRENTLQIVSFSFSSFFAFRFEIFTQHDVKTVDYVPLETMLNIGRLL
jgi:hypothetical protein